MVFKLEVGLEEDGVKVLRLSGRIEAKHLQELNARTSGNGQRFALEMEEVKLVDVAVVHFLGACEDRGIELRICPAYVRVWIWREKSSDG